jgi:D-alanyl-D-alanine carboxypeptidase (penicillin-binding protein 5/6)
MNNPLIREVVRKSQSRISGGRTLHTWNDLLSTFPRLIGVKTGHTSAAGWSQVAAARGRGLTIYAALLGEPTRAERNSDLTRLLAWGLSRYRVAQAVREDRVYARAELPYGRRPVALVAPRSLLRVVRIERPLVERVVAPANLPLPVRAGDRLGEVRVYADGKLLASSPLVAARTVERPGLVGRVGWYAEETLDNVWGWIS